jgi:hypothetical protein
MSAGLIDRARPPIAKRQIAGEDCCAAGSVPLVTVRLCHCLPRSPGTLCSNLAWCDWCLQVREVLAAPPHQVDLLPRTTDTATTLVFMHVRRLAEQSRCVACRTSDGYCPCVTELAPARLRVVDTAGTNRRHLFNVAQLHGPKSGSNRFAVMSQSIC